MEDITVINAYNVCKVTFLSHTVFYQYTPILENKTMTTDDKLFQLQDIAIIANVSLLYSEGIPQVLLKADIRYIPTLNQFPQSSAGYKQQVNGDRTTN